MLRFLRVEQQFCGRRDKSDTRDSFIHSTRSDGASPLTTFSIASYSARMLEFESDGERDSLTGLLAPARFLTILESEIAIAAREGRSLTLLTLSLSTAVNSMNPPTIESAERLLKNLASTLLVQMRAGDHCGRIAEDGFWILARGDRTAVEIAVYRFLAEHESYHWLIEYFEISKGEKVKELLRRVDALYFAP